jgi:hypothetical protein
VSAFTKLGQAVAEAERLIRTAPLHNATPSPDADLLGRVKEKLSEALGLHGDAVKEAKKSEPAEAPTPAPAPEPQPEPDAKSESKPSGRKS